MGMKMDDPVESAQLPWFRRPLPKRARVAGAGYAVVVIFGLGAGVARISGASVSLALVVGIVAAAPLVIALIGDRITGIKAFSVEISLTEVTVPVEGDFSGAVMTSAEMGGSAAPDLLASIEPLMENRSKLLRINLRDDNYWWSTRLFLVAALAEDYTAVEALIFVRAGEERILVGLASPRAVRTGIGAVFPDYEKAYRKVRMDSVAPLPDGRREVNDILTWRWSDAFADPEGLIKVPENGIKVTVSSAQLRDWLRADLDTEAVPYGPLSPLLRYRINSRGRRYAAMTDRGQLVAVVDRDELAVRSTAAELEARFKGRS
jgi:hypothetical protein